MSNLRDERTDELIGAFRTQFQSEPTHVASGPGRVNLIGEHTDYNDGFVLPVALKRDVRFVFRPRADRQVRLSALEFDEQFAFDLDAMAYVAEPLWANYVMGMAWSLEQAGLRLTGIDAVISGNVPRGSGLSSSAAVEVAAAHAFLAASNQLQALTGPQIAKAAQRAENQFVGVNCGIMDQFISVLGKENHALLIDCRSLTYELVPMPEEVAMVIGNTRASRSLASSAYNERRAQCEAGVAILQTVLPGITRPARRDQRPVGGQQGAAVAGRLPALPPYRRRKRAGAGYGGSLAAGRPGDGRPAHGRQPCQPARRLRGEQPGAGCDGDGHAPGARRLRRPVDRGRLWRLCGGAGGAGRRTRAWPTRSSRITPRRPTSGRRSTRRAPRMARAWKLSSSRWVTVLRVTCAVLTPCQARNTSPRHHPSPCQRRQMVHPIVAVQAPDFPARVFHVLEVGDACVVAPDLAAAPGADVEDVVEGELDDAAMTDHHHGLVPVA